MQNTLFGAPEQAVKATQKDFKVYDWKQKFRSHTLAQSQSDLFDASHITTYSSGVSSPADLAGYVQVNAPVGVCVIDTSRPVRKMIGEYASDGGRIFCDSGAFRNFKARLKDSTVPLLDFDNVMEFYHDILKYSVNPSNLILVAPDRVGDQCASMVLLYEYHREITLLVRKGGENYGASAEGT